MHNAHPLVFAAFCSEQDPLLQLFEPSRQIPQAMYIASYLNGNGALSVILENNYFDRDYLAEFSEFYSQSSRGYPNICKRAHYFSANITRELFLAAAGGSEEHKKIIDDNYLGFIVFRPIPASPFGRTVLGWYKDVRGDRPRITQPSRWYKCTVAGVELKVYGLAWQQQDTGIAACATICLWTIFHSSAFDAWHAIPTTAEITKSAHSKNSYGSRVFPSNFLTPDQLLEAIKEMRLAPMMLKGEQSNGGFSVERFSSSCSALIRSGYPLLIIGQYIHLDSGIGHAVCAVGFRQEQSLDDGVPIKMLDEGSSIFYIHDDNIGPNVRFVVQSSQFQKQTAAGVEIENFAILAKQKPENAVDDGYPTNFSFKPEQIVIAFHEDMRLSIDAFQRNAFILSAGFVEGLKTWANDDFTIPGFCYTTRFFKLADYMNYELGQVLAANNSALASTRMQLHENVSPMSNHIAVLRITLPANKGTIMDVIFDTSCGDRNMSAFAHVLYDASFEQFLIDAGSEQFLGVRISAFLGN